jgi:pimeloyl-ACP methyl ester carboxylesterase
MDHVRDLLRMVDCFRTEMPRPLVGIGHSMGGNQLVNLSLIHPRLLEGLILIDPVIQRFASARGNYSPAQASSTRRDRWPSRSAAAAAFRKSPFYQSWDPRVLDLWIEHGLRELPTALYPSNKGEERSVTNTDESVPSEKEVTLKTTKHMEVFTFMRPNWDPILNRRTHPDVSPVENPNSPFYRAEPIITFHQLPHLRPPVFYIFGADSVLSAPQFRADKLANTGTGVGGSGGVKAGNVTEILMSNTGHLIPMEKVTETAQQCVAWLGKRVGKSWREDEQKQAAEWARRSLREKTTMSDEYLAKIRGQDWLKKSKL